MNTVYLYKPLHSTMCTSFPTMYLRNYFDNRNYNLNKSSNTLHNLPINFCNVIKINTKMYIKAVSLTALELPGEN